VLFRSNADKLIVGDDFRNGLNNQLVDLEKQLDELQLRMTLKAAKTLRNWGLPRAVHASDLRVFVHDLQSRLHDEIEDAYFLALTLQEKSYFEPQEPLFGSEFEAKFPSALFELDEAAKCLALGRSTAAAFHLMRLIEIGLKATANCLGATIPTGGSSRNWGTVLKAIKDQIDSRNKIPGGTGWAISGDRAVFEVSYASLDAVRVAWRNPTMHVENKYTHEEAEYVFGAVRGFMRQLASRCDESGNPKA